MRKKEKIIIVFFIAALIINIFSSVYASINPEEYNPQNALSDNDTKVVFGKVSLILGAIRNISITASVIILMIIGFKYIIGSAEEKANYKSTMMPYIIGCIMASVGTTLVSYIYNMIN